MGLSRPVAPAVPRCLPSQVSLRAAVFTVAAACLCLVAPAPLVPGILKPTFAQEAAQGGNLPPAIREIAALFQQGTEALGKRDYPRAETAFQGAYDRAAALGDKYSMGAALDALGGVYLARGDTRPALQTKLRAIELLREGGNPKGLARGLMNIGAAYRALGQYDRAIAAVEESVQIWEGLKDAPGLAAALLALGDLHRTAGHFTRAIEIIQQVIQMREQMGADPNSLATAHNDLGLAYYVLAQFKQARQEYDIALNLAKAASNSKTYSAVLNNVGMALAGEGRYPEARAAYTEAIALREKGDDPEAYAESLANLAAAFYREGRHDAALFYGRRALAVAEKTGTKRLIAGQCLNIGVSLEALGQHSKAVESYVRALALYDEMGNTDGIATAAFDLAMVRLHTGDPAGAIPLFERILPVAQKQGNGEWVAQVQEAWGVALDRLGKTMEALPLFLAAHRQYEKLGNPQTLGRSWNNLGNTYYGLKRLDEAEKAFTQALALKNSGGAGGNADAAARTQSNLAAVYMEEGKWDKAADLMKSAVANAERVRDQIAAPSEVGALRETDSIDVYARYAGVLVHLGNPAEALAQVERGRGQGLARQAAQGRARWRGLLPEGDARKLEEATGTLRAADANLRATEGQAEKLASSGADDESVRQAEAAAGEARRVRDEAQQAVTTLRNEIAERRPAFRSLCGLDAPTPDSLLALAKAHPDTLYLTWAVGSTPDETLLFALRPDSVRAFSIPAGPGVLTRQVRAWRDAITPAEEGGGAGEEPQKEQALAKALYALLLGPAEKAGLLSIPAVKRLVVLGDGPLRELPFAALMDSAGKRLVERFPLATGVSLRLLTPQPASAGTDSGAPPPAGRGILCIADPGGGDARRAESDSLSGFAPLPAARREGQAIARLFGDGATSLIGDAATRDAVLKQLGTVRLLHFATHGYLDDQDGLRSGLLIAPTPGPNADEEIPLLTASEILDHPLAAELAVLSACETGRGQVSGGEGLLGLVWAFRAAGCPSVIASQWSVDDDATGRLMVRLYEGLRSGMRRDDALRAAMLSIKDAGKAAPYYWAAFQLNGEAGPLGGGSNPRPNGVK